MYATTPLRPEFRGEHLPGNRQGGDKFVRYLRVEERDPYRLFAHDGLLYTGEQRPLDTTHTRTLWTPQGGRAVFVMDEYGWFYASPYHLLGEFHHSSLLAGAPVAGAGEISAAGGRVVLVSDHSTHYGPARRFTRQVVDSWRDRGSLSIIWTSSTTARPIPNRADRGCGIPAGYTAAAADVGCRSFADVRSRHPAC
ncbi:hypothetical protein GCM10011588_54090 [Nocardia jinanensis]|uniref:Uncharacterized protein n=1 Tax=Nocardia jinanensis TaxID=382504 RepID=A0A917RUC0_9NOCA|nr:hypothetical protein GCM10011588_54090 [Nocardia jinanensis]